MTLSQIYSAKGNEQIANVRPVISEGQGDFEDASLVTAAEEKALVRRIDRK